IRLEDEIYMLTFGLKRFLFLLKNKDYQSFSNMMCRFFLELKTFTSSTLNKVVESDSKYKNKANHIIKQFNDLKLSRLDFSEDNFDYKETDLHFQSTKIQVSLKKIENDRNKLAIQLQRDFNSNKLNQDLWGMILKSISDEKKMIVKYIKRLWRIDDRFNDSEAQKLKTYKFETIILFKEIWTTFDLLAKENLPALSKQIMPMIKPMYFTFYSINYITDFKN
ncbi:MAG: hypothetical protein ACRC4L_01260, partial [Mycoplasma sp.]